VAGLGFGGCAAPPRPVVPGRLQPRGPPWLVRAHGLTVARCVDSFLSVGVARRAFVSLVGAHLIGRSDRTPAVPRCAVSCYWLDLQTARCQHGPAGSGVAVQQYASTRRSPLPKSDGFVKRLLLFLRIYNGAAPRDVRTSSQGATGLPPSGANGACLYTSAFYCPALHPGAYA